MKKILFLNYEYPPLGGGAGVATEALLQEFARRSDVEVHLVTSAIGSALEHERVGGEVYIHRLPIGKNPKQLHSQSLRDIIVYSWKAWRFLGSFLQAQQTPFDVTLAFFTVPCGFIAYALRLRYSLPYVVSLRGADVPGFSEKYNRFYFFLSPIIRFLWRKAEDVIPNSRGLEELARRTAPKQAMTIIENGVNVEVFTPSEQENRSDTEEVVFLTMARLTKRKGIDRLIRAFAPLTKETQPKVRLLIGGDGEEDGALRSLSQTLGIAEQVSFLGRVDHARVAELYRRADVFVLPSKNEGMSNAALEALASGLPLIVSKTGGMTELVTDRVNGLLVNSEDISTFTTALTDLAASSEKRRAYGAESRRRAEARSWHQVAQRFLTSLEKSSEKPV